MLNILMNQEVVNQIMTALWSAIGIAITGAVSVAIAKLSHWLKSKIKDEKLRNLVDSTLGLVEDIVISVNQTYVDELLKQGKFDAQAQKQALNKAKQIATQMISTEGKDLIINEYGDLDKWLEIVIEAKVKEVKQNLLKNK